MIESKKEKQIYHFLNMVYIIIFLLRVRSSTFYWKY